jgi:hypothetical protein
MRHCRYSIHDLSRVELSAGLPRFNMPFEAGMASTVWLLERRHQRFILAAERFQLQRTLSDLNGTDPYVHGGSPEGILRVTTNIFARRGLRLTVGDLRYVFKQLRRYARREMRRGELEGLFSPDAFGKLVTAATAIVERSGLGARRPRRRRASR